MDQVPLSAGHNLVSLLPKLNTKFKRL